MKLNKLMMAISASAFLTACGGDINVSVGNSSTVDNTDSTEEATNPCASYTQSGTTYQGVYESSGNCTYDMQFATVGHTIETDLTFAALDNDGIHMLSGSIEMGSSINNNAGQANDGEAAPSAGTMPASEGGSPEGSVLTIEAGATMAMPSGAFIRINRGSQIIADGTESDPIVITSVTDVLDPNNDMYAVQQWGGLQINGNGLTNACTESQRTNNQCSIPAEGSEGADAFYGGNDNTESSGILNYVIVKHSGYDVGDGDELNGITFNAVGSGTEVDYVQVLSTYDDGLEFFGGDVSVKHAIMMYVDDDSFDFSDGHTGIVQHALVIHQPTDGNRCVEANGQDDATAGSTQEEQFHSLMPYTNVKIANLTCITSGNSDGTHGDSEGVLMRVGFNGGLYNSIVTTYQSEGTSNELLEFDDGVAYQAHKGDVAIRGNFFGGSEFLKSEGTDTGTADNSGNELSTLAEFVAAQGGNETTNNYNTIQAVLSGIYSGETTATAVTNLSSIDARFDDVDYVGGVSADNDWTSFAEGLDELPAGLSN